MKHLLLTTIAAVVVVRCAVTVEIGSRTSAVKESIDDGKAVSEEVHPPVPCLDRVPPPEAAA